MRRFLVCSFAAVAVLVLGSFTGAARATPLDCDEPDAICAEPADSIGYGGEYTGHDEPSLLFYSNTPGSGNSNLYRLRLPQDPPVMAFNKTTTHASAMFGAPAIALALLTHEGGSNPLLRTVALIGLAVFVIALVAFAAALWRDRFAQRVGDTAARIATWAMHLIRRKGVTWGGASLVAFRQGAVGLLRRRWWVLTLATIAGQLTVFGVLLTCLRTLGVSAEEVSFIEAFAGWTLVRLLGSLPITPGGIGIVELGLTGALVGFGGANDAVVAAVLLYRALTVLPTLVLGLLAGVAWRRLRPDPALEGVEH